MEQLAGARHWRRLVANGPVAKLFPNLAPPAAEIVKSDAIAVVTVHGTNDSAAGPDGEKWFQRGSAFSAQLQQALSGAGVSSEIIPFLWSGKNSAWAREEAAKKLVRVIGDASLRCASVHVVGHSHGGNVANEAAVLMRWGTGRDAPENLSSLTTVGTPFFEVQFGPWQRVAAPIFAVLMWPALVAASIAWGVLLFFVAIALFQYTSELLSFALPMAVATAALSALWFGAYFARSHLARVRRPRRRSTQACVFSIWHQNDEAIAFLRNAEKVKIEAFPRWALFRGARRNAIPFAITIALAPLLILPVIIALLFGIAAVSQLLSYGSIYLAPGEEQALWSFLVLELQLAVAVPVTFSVAYIAYLLFMGVGFGASMEFLFRGFLNRFISRVFRGIAFGRDNDQTIGNVSQTSHTFQTEEHMLAGEAADRMRSAAETAASALLEKYRWALFNVDDDQATSLANLAQDAMTWNSLIHTTYFDQPEMADIIAGHIRKQVTVT